ncbi:hypothetical protein [uncultured Tenacibaculum sp.]|uniref:hypothetical protein n=1 Tax=uncultured Tenacibaculum sp. TaxID=174713 RepID=UPI002608A181|nr:hypothetical protein [uncultured Tenacibaculum sp.]
MLLNTLKKVPTYNKKELLFYIAENNIETVLQITTNSGNLFTGYLINIAEVLNEGITLLLQLDGSNNILHINLRNIESIIFQRSNDVDIINLLSKGTIEKPKAYQNSSRLDVKRKFKNFSDVILEKSGVTTSLLPMDLPEDGKQLNRIHVITEQIQKLIVDLLSEEDAKESWVTKFNEVQFTEAQSLKITSSASQLNIHFPFADVLSPEINESNFNDLLLQNL